MACLLLKFLHVYHLLGFKFPTTFPVYIKICDSIMRLNLFLKFSAVTLILMINIEIRCFCFFTGEEEPRD